jgi:hypothetical protein
MSTTSVTPAGGQPAPGTSPATAAPPSPPIFAQPPVRYVVWPIHTVFLILVLASLALMGIVGLQSWQDWKEMQRSGGQTVWSKGGVPVTSNQAVADIQSGFNEYKDRTDNLQKLVAALVGLSSLYAVVLAITGYVNGQNYLKQLEISGNEFLQQARGKVDEANAKLTEAGRQLDDAKAKLAEAQKTGDDLQKKFNAFTQVNENLKQVIERVSHAMPDIEPVALTYERLSSDLRESIYFSERSLAFAQFLSFEDGGSLGEGMSQALMALARFYRARFHSESAAFKPAPHLGVSRSSWSPEQQSVLGLLERAWMYGKMAVERDANNFSAWTDLEMTEVLLKLPGIDPELALKKSLALREDQQKARYMTSILQHSRGEYDAAEATLTQAMARKLWETEENPERRPDLYYNRACARAKLAVGKNLTQSQKMAFLDGALEDLKTGCPKKNDHALKVFDDDCAAGGDLEPLVTQYPTEVGMIRERLEGKRPSI